MNRHGAGILTFCQNLNYNKGGSGFWTAAMLSGAM